MAARTQPDGVYAEIAARVRTNAVRMIKPDGEVVYLIRADEEQVLERLAEGWRLAAMESSRG